MMKEDRDRNSECTRNGREACEESNAATSVQLEGGVSNDESSINFELGQITATETVPGVPGRHSEQSEHLCNGSSAAKQNASPAVAKRVLRHATKLDFGML